MPPWWPKVPYYLRCSFFLRESTNLTVTRRGVFHDGSWRVAETKTPWGHHWTHLHHFYNNFWRTWRTWTVDYSRCKVLVKDGLIIPAFKEVVSLAQKWSRGLPWGWEHQVPGPLQLKGLWGGSDGAFALLKTSPTDVYIFTQEKKSAEEPEAGRGITSLFHQQEKLSFQYVHRGSEPRAISKNITVFNVTMVSYVKEPIVT